MARRCNSDGSLKTALIVCEEVGRGWRQPLKRSAGLRRLKARFGPGPALRPEGPGGRWPFSERENLGRQAAVVRAPEKSQDRLFALKLPGTSGLPAGIANQVVAIVLELVLPHKQIDDSWPNPKNIEIHDGLFAIH